MYPDNTNIYKAARRRACLTQEQAAEALDLSVESVKAYETGQRVPPAATVRLMAERYATPGLTLEHARATDELGIIPETAAPQPFPLAALQLYNHMIAFAEKHRGQQLLRIAEDGVIDEAERPILDEIVCELEGISAAFLAIKCCEDAKKKNAPRLAPQSVPFPAELRTTAQLLYHNSAGRQAKSAPERRRTCYDDVFHRHRRGDCDRGIDENYCSARYAEETEESLAMQIQITVSYTPNSHHLKNKSVISRKALDKARNQ